MNSQNKNNIPFARQVHPYAYLFSNHPETNTASITSSNLEPQAPVNPNIDYERLRIFLQTGEKLLSVDGPSPPTDEIIEEVNEDPMKLEYYLPPDFVKTLQWQLLVLRALQKNGLAIKYIIPHYNEQTIPLILFYCAEALNQNGMALEHMESLQDVLYLVEKAVNKNPKAIVFASDNVKRQLLKEYFYHSLNPLGYYSNRRLLKNNTILPLLYYIKLREQGNIGFKEELQKDIDDVITNLNENERKLNQYKKLKNYKNSTNIMNSMKKDRFPSGF